MSGGKGGKSTDLILEDGEFIKSVQVSPIKLPSQGRFRISYIKFVTNKGRFLEGGKKTQSGRILAGGTDGPHHGQKLVGFAGRRGAEVDAFYAIWGNVY
ncbi:hypothetical protein CCR75_007315 [Bremia lactucae]|uniref:Jacalin-type lectin domain-containing protein n=1 Tax=Bremia lactucae TaxID=4779 RepID=A0A976FHV0_BRELC|nr:hypothetical protein CCR75_007315 [Bremia lactucae]